LNHDHYAKLIVISCISVWNYHSCFLFKISSQI